MMVIIYLYSQKYSWFVKIPMFKISLPLNSVLIQFQFSNVVYVHMFKVKFNLLFKTTYDQSIAFNLFVQKHFRCEKPITSTY